MRRLLPGTVIIGNPRGKIALLLDEADANDVAHTYGPGDMAYDELMQAIPQAYPETPHD